MEFGKGSSPSVATGAEETLFSWPHLLIRELLVFLALLIILLVVSLRFDAPLEEIANPVMSANPSKAPWYFLGLQEMVSYDALWGGVLMPSLIALGLILLHYLDRSQVGVGVWFHPQRKLLIAVFTAVMVTQCMLIIIGTYMRGPNWEFYWPWEEWPTVR